MAMRSVIRLALVGLLGLGLAAPVALAPSDAWAQKERREKPSTTKGKALSACSFEKIEEGQAALSEGQHALALQIFNGLLQQTRCKLTPFDKATINQFIGYVYADKGDYNRAIPFFKSALNSGEFTLQQSLQLQFNLAQLLLAEERYTEAIRLLEDWFAKTETKTAQSYMLLCNAYAVTEQFRKALNYCETGLGMATERREDWHRLMLAIYLELQQYNKGVNLLEKMVGYWPDRKQYWSNLASVYGELKRERASYLVLRAMYEAGMLSTSRELVRLAQMHLFFEAPYYAGKLLDTEIKRGRVEKTADNYELLANAWYSAREWKKAIPALEQAASRSKEGDLYLRLGSSYVQEEEWRKAESAIVKAINKGKLDEPGEAWILLGYARLEQNKFETARDAFSRALRFDKTKERAGQYLKYVEQELRRQDLAAAEAAEEAEIAAGEKAAEEALSNLPEIDPGAVAPPAALAPDQSDGAKIDVPKPATQ